MRKTTAIGLCSAPVAWLSLHELESRLLDAGVLNTKDMTFAGNESGTPWEYASNIWHWDAALCLVMPVAGPWARIGTTGSSASLCWHGSSDGGLASVATDAIEVAREARTGILELILKWRPFAASVGGNTAFGSPRRHSFVNGGSYSSRPCIDEL